MATVDSVISGERSLADEGRITPRPGYAGHEGEQLSRLRKIEGQVREVTRMVDQDGYCIDVLTQISAVKRALHEVALSLLDDHIRHCVRGATRTNGDGAAKLDELTVALRRALWL
jgi:CsoR family transcriptional regulator, copper-sensing transcriptional repressor